MRGLVGTLAVILGLVCPPSPAAYGDVREYYDTSRPYEGTYYRTKRYRQERVSVPMYLGGMLPHHKGGAVSNSTQLTSVFGFGAVISFERRWAIELDILHVRKDFSFDDSVGGARVNLSYMQFPLLFKYKFSRKGMFLLGPYFAPIIVNAQSTQGGTTTDLTGAYSSDYGVTAGVQFTYPLSRYVRAGVHLRYNLGLININQQGNQIQTRDATALFVLEVRL